MSAEAVNNLVELGHIQTTGNPGHHALHQSHSLSTALYISAFVFRDQSQASLNYGVWGVKTPPLQNLMHGNKYSNMAVLNDWSNTWDLCNTSNSSHAFGRNNIKWCVIPIPVETFEVPPRAEIFVLLFEVESCFESKINLEYCVICMWSWSDLRSIEAISLTLMVLNEVLSRSLLNKAKTKHCSYTQNASTSCFTCGKTFKQYI